MQDRSLFLSYLNRIQRELTEGLCRGPGCPSAPLCSSQGRALLHDPSWLHPHFRQHNGQGDKQETKEAKSAATGPSCLHFFTWNSHGHTWLGTRWEHYLYSGEPSARKNAAAKEEKSVFVRPSVASVTLCFGEGHLFSFSLFHM